jgi:hypothetical protein
LRAAATDNSGAMDGSPLSFGSAESASDKVAERVNGMVHYAIGFLSGLVWHITTPQEQRRRVSRERWASEWGRWVRRLALAPEHREGPQRIVSLRRAVTGLDRAAVVKLLGAPAASSTAGASPQQPKHYWQADVWYYAFDPVRRHAVAVTFADGKVEAVDWFPGPTR